MKPYNSDPHVPEWISALDGQLLSSAEIRVLDFIWYCKKHSCRTSNDRIGSHVHLQHYKVQEAIQKLYRLDLIAIDNYGKRTRTLKPVPWADRETWEKYKKLQSKSKTDPAPMAPHITKLDKTTPKESSSLVCSESPTTGDVFLPGGCRPQPPACGSVGGGSSETSAPKPRSAESGHPKRDVRSDDSQLNAQQLYERCLSQCADKQLAKELTLFKFPNAQF